MARKSYDWVAIKIEFLKSSLSIPEFSERYDIPLGTLKKQVAQGKWLDERSDLGTETVRKSTSIATDARALKLAQFDDDCVELADEFRKKAKEFLYQIDSPMALKALTGAMKDTQAMARLALGASTENQAVTEGFNREEWLMKLSKYEQEDGQNGQ